MEEKMMMISRERLLKTLNLSEPDRVPYCEFGIDFGFVQKLFSMVGDISLKDHIEDVGSLKSPFSVEESKRIATILHMDNIYYAIRAPVFASKHIGKDGRIFYGNGLICTPADLDKIQLPDPYDMELYEDAINFAENKGDFAACFVTRIGIFPTIDSMGFENFCISLFENPDFVNQVFSRYVEWTEVVASKICKLGFDIFVSTDDLAFNTGTFFSPEIFRAQVLPGFQKVADKINLPWILHSDGNITAFLKDIADKLPVSGIHPIEKGAMDIVKIKKEYGERFCLFGNVPLPLLSEAEPSDIEVEVKNLIGQIAPGGGYVVTSGNSLTNYIKPENAIAMAEAVQKYGKYPVGD
jgi:uroporphyrinogen decarboxylase